MSAETPTPRTDVQTEVHDEKSEGGTAGYNDLLYFARQLERELAASEARCAELRLALEHSVNALDDWLRTYVRDDGFLNEDVQRSEQRIYDNGGTIAYISRVQAENRAALASAPSAKEGQQDEELRKADENGKEK